jgi:hypothetical protein
MDRAEHLDWAKRRALEYIDDGHCSLAVSSMISDLGKHPELEKSAQIGAVLALSLNIHRPEQVRKWIVGFN